jgi:transposase
VSSVQARFLSGGEEALFDRRSENGRRKVDDTFLDRLRKALTGTPQDFGWLRASWTRELLCYELQQQGAPLVAACTMGRALAQLRARRKAPKPFVSCPWPTRRRQRRIFELRSLVAHAPGREPVFYVDEVDIHLNPKIGREWTLPGQRRYVRTPGKNEKHYLAGALHAVTGKLTWVGSASKSSDLFCKLVWRLVMENKHARRIHLILDNYIIHSSKKTKRFLAQFGDKVVLHFLPPYCPDENAIERVWLDVHAAVTRNHRCSTLRELLTHVDRYLRARNAARANRARLPAKSRRAA